ncbi:uncharacterized protein LOC143883593 [Tasmannia lanceolata]|uniref:uncharacterized protein LOC143883593 n=1 Tax=Tasmannia lanceolata TaxID=3420 RepID=UPI0040638ACA
MVSLGDFPADPSQWEYGVSLKFDQGALDNYGLASACTGCEKSGGVCGYTPPYNYFVCVCNNGINTSSDCQGQLGFWSSAPPGSGYSIAGIALLGWLLVLGSLLGL